MHGETDNDAACTRAIPRGMRGWPTRENDVLRLVHSAQPTMDLSTGIRPGPSLICIHGKRRSRHRHKGGIIMKTFERTLETAGRFAVGLGSALALVCAYVIVSGDPGLGVAEVAKAPEVVRLEPVVVTISAERFAAIQAEERGASMLARKHDAKLKQG
jgi:hypothetical protein